MSTEAPSARELTRRLVARMAGRSDALHGTALAAHAACELTYRDLTRSLGASGSHALLARALEQATPKHPLLKAIRVARESETGFDGVIEVVQAHGAPAVVAGLEAVLETLLGLLGRLIGDDIVARLVEQSTLIGTRDDEDAK